MTRIARMLGFTVLLLALVAQSGVAAADIPNFTQFGYPTVAASALIAPTDTVALTVNNQTVTIRPGTFDTTVVFDLLVTNPADWQTLVPNRAVRAAFAFRVTDATTGSLIGAFKQPVLYAYTGSDARDTDTVLDTAATNPATATPNPNPITFDGKVNHPFKIATVGWLVVSAPTPSTRVAPDAEANAS